MRTFLTPGMMAIVVPALVALATVAARSRSGLGWRRVLAAALLRAGLAFGLIAALARPAWLDERIEPRALVVVMDVSDSVPAAARRAAIDRVEQRLAGLRAEANLTVAMVAFAGHPRLLTTFPAAGTTGLGEWEKSVLLWDDLGRTLRRELDRLREQPGADAPQSAGGARRTELEALVGWLDASVAQLDLGRTDLAAALAFAGAAVPEASARSLWLFSDGQWDDRGATAWGDLAGVFSSVQVDTLSSPPEPDLVGESLIAPVRVRVGEPFDLRARFSSTTPAQATAQLLVDSQPVAEATLRFVGPGVQEFVFPDRTMPEGLHRVQVLARLPEAEEGETRNNLVLGAVEVHGRPRVALIEGFVASATSVERALAAQDFDVERVPAGSFPSRASELARWQGVALVEPTADMFTRAQQMALYDWVCEGGSLFVATGVDGKALAALRGTELAKLLPVKIPEAAPTPPQPEDPPPDPKADPPPDSDPPATAEVELPTIALVLAIDKSGSMEGQKLLLAKESVIASARILRPDDLVGVLAFDGQPRWAVSIMPARRIQYIEDRVSRIGSSGGTEIYPALVMAYRELRAVDAQVKHVILLTDGYTTMSDFAGLLERMAKDRITVSTVGVGSEFDGVLLANISKWGKGTYDFTDKLDEVPAIFLRETRRAARLKSPHEAANPGAKPSDPATATRPPDRPEIVTPSVEPGKQDPEQAPLGGPEGVVAPSRSAITAGLDQDRWPQLDRFAVTELRAQAAPVLLTETSRKPVLAFWRYDLGRVMTWTSDFRERGAPSWVRWDRLPRLLAQAFRFNGAGRDDSTLDVAYRIGPGRQRDVISIGWTYGVQAAGGAGPERVAATAWLMEGAEEKPVALAARQSGPAAWEVDVPVGATGRIIPVQVRHGLSEGREVPHRLGVGRAYPQELKQRQAETGGIEWLRQALGAAVAEGPNPGATPPLPAVRKVQRFEEKGPELIFLLIAVFFVEVLVRKLRR